MAKERSQEEESLFQHTVCVLLHLALLLLMPCGPMPILSRWAHQSLGELRSRFTFRPRWEVLCFRPTSRPLLSSQFEAAAVTIPGAGFSRRTRPGLPVRAAEAAASDASLAPCVTMHMPNRQWPAIAVRDV